MVTTRGSKTVNFPQKSRKRVLSGLFVCQVRASRDTGAPAVGHCLAFFSLSVGRRRRRKRRPLHLKSNHPNLSGGKNLKNAQSCRSTWDKGEGHLTLKTNKKMLEDWSLGGRSVDPRRGKSSAGEEAGQARQALPSPP